MSRRKKHAREFGLAARLCRPLAVEEDAFVAGRGWRLVFRAPEQHVLESPREEPDDWVDLDLLFRAVRLVAGDVPVHELRTGDQTVTLLFAPPDAARDAAAAALSRIA